MVAQVMSYLCAGFVTFGLMSVTPSASALSLKCTVGATACIKTQGTTIPAKDVVRLLDTCSDFTNEDIGKRALRMSADEMLKVTGGNVTPLSRAYFAYDELHDSPLKFNRSIPAERRYEGVKTACSALQRDFDNPALWVK
jgi:hypothetical protein